MGLNGREQKYCEVTREEEKELKLKRKKPEKKKCVVFGTSRSPYRFFPADDKIMPRDRTSQVVHRLIACHHVA